MPLISCGSTKKIEFLPEIDFPSFPIDPDKVTYYVTKNPYEEDLSLVHIKWNDSDSKIVTLPYWFFKNLMEYEIDVDTAKKKYKYLRSENAR